MKLEAQERIEECAKTSRTRSEWWRQLAAGPATSGERLVHSDRRGPTLRPGLAGILFNVPRRSLAHSSNATSLPFLSYGMSPTYMSLRRFESAYLPRSICTMFDEY